MPKLTASFSPTDVTWSHAHLHNLYSTRRSRKSLEVTLSSMVWRSLYDFLLLLNGTIPWQLSDLPIQTEATHTHNTECKYDLSGLIRPRRPMSCTTSKMGTLHFDFHGAKTNTSSLS